MKLSFLGLCFAATAAATLYTGASAQLSSASAEEGCIVTMVNLHVKRCPAGVEYASNSDGSSGGGGEVIEPTITPTAGPPEGCIKTLVNLHVKRCPAGD